MTKLEDPTPTEELVLPSLSSSGPLHMPQGEPGLRESLDRLRALEEAIRQHEQATSGPAVTRRPGDLALYKRMREGGSPTDSQRDN
jgi:hypothetical protein